MKESCRLAMSFAYYSHLYLLAASPMITEELEAKFGPNDKSTWFRLISNYKEKMAEIDPCFYTTEAMIPDGGETIWLGQIDTLLLSSFCL